MTTKVAAKNTSGQRCGACCVNLPANAAECFTAWGEIGMRQLWAAAPHRVVGAGAEDVKFLQDVSSRIGKEDQAKWSSSKTSGKSPSSGISSSIAAEDILTVAELAALSFGTVVVLPSGGRAILAETIGWFDRPEMKIVVSASEALYKPKVAVNVSWN